MGSPGGGGTPGGGGPFGAAIDDALIKAKMFKILFGGILMLVKINKKSFSQNFFSTF
jgi:hypothetical protein